MCSEPKRLPYTRPPLADESLRGYLLSLAIQNGYRSLATLLAISASPKSRPSTFDTFDLGPLAELTAQPESSLRSLIYAHSINSSRIFLGQKIPSFLISSDRLKFCPVCIQEAPIFKAVWDLQLSVVCHEHGNYLVSECGECKRSTSWFGSPWYQCNCRYDLRNSPVKHADPDVINFSRYLMWSFLGEPKPQGSQLPAEMGNIPPGNLHWIVTMIGCWANGLVKGKISRRLESLPSEQRIETISRAKDIFTDWPSNFHDFLTHSRRLFHQPSAKSFMQREFGALYQTIMSEIKDPNCEFIRDQLRYYGESLAFREGVEFSGDVKVHALAKELGIGVSATRKMADRGVIKLLKEKGGYRKDKLVIDEPGVAILGETLPDRVSLQGISEILGLGIKITASLRDEGLFAVGDNILTDGRCKVMYSRTEVEKLRHGLASTAIYVEKVPSKQYQKISEAMRIHCINGLRRSDLLKAVLDGSLKIFTNAIDAKVDELYVDKNDARNYVLHLISRDPDFLDQESASVAFDINEKRLVAIAKSGLISSKIVTHGVRKYRLLSRKSVEAWISSTGKTK